MGASLLVDTHTYVCCVHVHCVPVVGLATMLLTHVHPLQLTMGANILVGTYAFGW